MPLLFLINVSWKDLNRLNLMFLEGSSRHPERRFLRCTSTTTETFVPLVRLQRGVAGLPMIVQRSLFRAVAAKAIKKKKA